jgi:hypothetical protein
MELYVYKKLVKAAELGDLVKMRAIIEAKKIFCVPWLLCAQELFDIRF